MKQYNISGFSPLLTYKVLKRGKNVLHMMLSFSPLLTYKVLKQNFIINILFFSFSPLLTYKVLKLKAKTSFDVGVFHPY